MIYVDEIVSHETPWFGGRSCHLISDESLAELLSFAGSIGLPAHWYQPKSYPHFDLSPSWRRRALAAGARALDRRPYVEAVRRGRAAIGLAPAAPRRADV